MSIFNTHTLAIWTPSLQVSYPHSKVVIKRPSEMVFSKLLRRQKEPKAREQNSRYHSKSPSVQTHNLQRTNSGDHGGNFGPICDSGKQKRNKDHGGDFDPNEQSDRKATTEDHGGDFDPNQ